jgi:hypothetical protein
MVKLAVVAQFNSDYFAKTGSKFMTIDEETSRIIDVTIVNWRSRRFHKALLLQCAGSHNRGLHLSSAPYDQDSRRNMLEVLQPEDSRRWRVLPPTDL